MQWIFAFLYILGHRGAARDRMATRSWKLWSTDSRGNGRTMAPLRGLSRRAFKPIYIVYYKLLFGRRFPFSERLAARVHAWELATGRGDAPVAKDVWEEQYRHGGWEFMRDLNELARYSVIAGYLHYLHPGGSVLDVGSGEGLLRDHLLPFGYARYHGIDLSAAAIAHAAPRAGESTTFAVA